MKYKLWNSKNGALDRFGASKEVGPSRDTLMLGQRATLYQHGKKQMSTISHLDDIAVGKESTFDQLKKEIRHLENSQFLCMKQRCQTEPDQTDDFGLRMTGKEFMPSKKIAQLEKFKMHLRRKGKTRKISLLLQKTQPEEVKELTAVSYLEVKDFNTSHTAHHAQREFQGSKSNQKQPALKRKETPSIVRKYYRPQTGHNTRSMSQLARKETEVRGRGLKSSHTNRKAKQRQKQKDKQNILIYCF